MTTSQQPRRVERGRSTYALVPNGAPAGTYLVTLAPADPHGGATPDITEASVTVTVLNNLTSDITSQPGKPPLAPVQQQVDVPKPVPDSVIIALHGTISNSGITTPTGPAPACPIDNNDVYCGYATASQVGVLVPVFPAGGFERSFIVRTYQTGAAGSCQQAPRAFFFKVCHR